MTRALSALWALVVASGCGYRIAGASADPLGPLAVTAAPVVVASAFAEDQVLAGARAELASRGRLAACDPRTDASCPALVVELVRVEEGGAGPGAAGPGSAPLDRAVTLTLRGRAFVRRSEGAPPERLGPDVTVRELVARQDEPLTFHAARNEALGRAARRLGANLARGALR